MSQSSSFSPRPIGPPDAAPFGLGLLKLSTGEQPSWEARCALIRRALDGGVRLLDTAPSYAPSEQELHFGERLAREAVARWDGPQEEVTILTKAGMARPKGRWVPRGDAASIRASVEGSCEALGVERLPVVLLHAPDPRIPFEETLAALAELQHEGRIEQLGLCNVGIAQVRHAQHHFHVAALQHELSVKSRKSATEGLLALAKQLGIPFFAHRPFGGHAKAASLAKNRAMKPLAEKHGSSPWVAALATLLDRRREPYAEPVVPLVGVSRTETLKACFAALDVTLDKEDRARIEEKISMDPSEQALFEIQPPFDPQRRPQLAVEQTPSAKPEVVVLMGVQGAGKSTHVAAYEQAGYLRLNRDREGGSLHEMAVKLREALSEGATQAVLDNTYPTKASRFFVIQAAHAHGLPVRCRHVATPVNEARINVVLRMLERYGKLLGPEEFKEYGKTDPNLPPPAALNTYEQTFEPPSFEEGFAAVEEIPFARQWPEGLSEKGLLLDVDGTLRETKSGEIYPCEPEDIVLKPRRREVLESWLAKGYKLFFVSNQSGIASNKLTQEAAEACFARTAELLGLPVTEIAYCPHKAFPVSCFCRKPQPGLAVKLLLDHKLDPTTLVVVGDMASDEAFARGISSTYYDADEFFGENGPTPRP